MQKWVEKGKPRFKYSHLCSPPVFLRASPRGLSNIGVQTGFTYLTSSLDRIGSVSFRSFRFSASINMQLNCHKSTAAAELIDTIEAIMAPCFSRNAAAEPNNTTVCVYNADRDGRALKQSSGIGRWKVLEQRYLKLCVATLSYILLG